MLQIIKLLQLFTLAFAATRSSIRSAASCTVSMACALLSSTLMSKVSSRFITISTCNKKQSYTTKIIQLKQRDLYFVEGNHGFRRRRLLTVSRESAPSAVNLVSPLISVPSTTASCFLTISQTFATVSGFACLLRRIALHHQ